MRRNKQLLTDAIEQAVTKADEDILRFLDALNAEILAYHEAGLPTALSSESIAGTQLDGELFAALSTLPDKIKANRPKTNDSGLNFIGGISHLVNGDKYFVDNQVLTIPSEYDSLYINGRLGPNEVSIEGRFRFVGNATGKNAFGATVNIEQYECDPDYSVSLHRAIAYDRDFQLLLKKMSPIRSTENPIECLFEVFENLLGAKELESVRTNAQENASIAIAARKPPIPFTVPPPNKKNAIAYVAHSLEKAELESPQREFADLIPEFLNPAEKVTPSDVTPQQASVKNGSRTPSEGKTSPSQMQRNANNPGLPKSMQKTVHSFIHKTKNLQNLRWYYGDSAEAKTFRADKYWTSRGIIGYGAVSRQVDTVHLWRCEKKGSNQNRLSLSVPKGSEIKGKGLLAWVWRDAKPGMIKVFAVENQSGAMQLAATEKQHDWLVKTNGWKVQFVFYMYPMK